ncbi:M12 family metallopeptidase [Sphaerisporangium perillae]|uniref:M12 family metallopeptidase n=1 Tax=Sphaerisporangium perillae TaxID=2935860 RepID=UPI00200DDD94|nr:M12 family metallopeptidase [Sphaerisporangium perillae]
MRHIAILVATLAGLTMGASPAAAEDDPLDSLWLQQTERPSLSITTPDITGHPHTIGFVDIDGHAVTEGDIVIGTPADAFAGKILMPGIFPEADPDLRSAAAFPDSTLADRPARSADCPRSSAGVATTQAGALWPDKKVPYVLSPTLSTAARDAVTQAMKDFHDNTCVRFIPRTGETGYLNIISGRGCYSYVGRVGYRPQDVSIGNGCERKGIAIHELLHAIGFYHEHSRADRDGAVTVHLENVMKGYEPQFQKLSPPQNRLFGTLDYGSVMLYGRNFFSANGLDTLVPNVPAQIGQRDGFSPADLAAVRTLYGCA